MSTRSLHVLYPPGLAPAAQAIDRRHWLRQACAAGLMTGGAGLGPGLAWARPAASAGPQRPMPLSLAPMALRQRRLPNGLQVISLPEPSTATVSVQVWYRVGAKDDPPGRSGFAHLFEHMMFKRTRYLADEAFDRLTEDVGGQNNAFTAEDMTAYQSEVPSNHLERLLWAEAERMAHLQVDQANFDSERRVVIEELHERVLADPYGRLFNALPEAAFSLHPYRRPVIGSERDLQAATLDDVRRFHATYYRPDNAVLIVVGDLEPGRFDAWVDRYFGRLKAPSTRIPRVGLREPRRRQTEQRALTGPQVPLPAVALVWQGPPAAHADAPALLVAQALLAAGESSRLNQALVYREQLAQAVGFWADLYADAGALVAYAIAASGRQPQAVATGLRQQIEHLARKPIPSAELEKVRAGLLTAALLARQTPQGQADAIGRAVLLLGDARAADREVAQLQAVRAADVQRALRRHVLQAKAVTLTYRQAGA